MFKVAFLVLLLVVGTARADIYTWTDKNGVVNVSNLPPPEGVRPTRVTHQAPKDPAREAAAREAAQLAELRALNERVAQLQEQVEQSRREPPQPVAFVPPMMPYAAPAAPYIVNVVTQQPAPTYGPTAGGCDYGWGDCGFGGFGMWPGYYAPGVVVVRGKNHGGRRFAPSQGQNQIVPPLIPPPQRTRPMAVGRSRG